MDKSVQHTTDSKRQIEIDVIGSMLLNCSVKTGILRDLQPRDISNKNFGVIYKEMLESKDRMFKIDPMTLLNENIARNKYLLNLMNECDDIDIINKCDWLVSSSIGAKL